MAQDFNTHTYPHGSSMAFSAFLPSHTHTVPKPTDPDAKIANAALVALAALANTTTTSSSSTSASSNPTSPHMQNENRVQLDTYEPAEELYTGSGMVEGMKYSRNVNYFGKEWEYLVMFEYRGYAVEYKFAGDCIAVFPATPENKAKMQKAGLKFAREGDLPEELKPAALLYAAEELPVDEDDEEDVVPDGFGGDKRQIRNGGFIFMAGSN